ncbi:18008_t:CDS:2 [Dentiscutata erythropus]|uniref:18008_t:CDS:1 n=1 Tax=Dentiscutata erythropus TaxID=1348616 RepID=A0A9N9NY92_9GLOM|nr:18008_t:CDS:2 [Dentiscutata erythropus]
MDSTETPDNQPTNFQNKMSKKKMSKKEGCPALPIWENFKKSIPNKFGYYSATSPDHIITFYLHKVAERGEKLSLADNKAIYNNTVEQTAFANWKDTRQPISEEKAINLVEFQLQENKKLKIEELIDLNNSIFIEENISNNRYIEGRGNLNFSIDNIINDFTTSESNTY